jgi:flavodoxin
MKSLVVYASQTGNTRKLAETVFENLVGEKEIFPVDEAPAPDGYDLIAVGFWLMSGKPDPKSAAYLERISGGQKIFLFATHGAAPGSDHARQGMEQAVGLAASADCIGTFSCQGEVNPKVLEKAGAKPQPPVWLGDAPAAVGHPDAEDLECLRREVKSRLA